MTARSVPSGPSFVVDLVGDLDATLGTIVDTALADLRARGARAIYLTTKRIALTSVEGVQILGRALAAARDAGVVVGLDAGNRKMRAAFVEARIAIASPDVPHDGVSRTLVIAHHAVAKTVRRPLAAMPLTA